MVVQRPDNSKPPLGADFSVKSGLLTRDTLDSLQPKIGVPQVCFDEIYDAQIRIRTDRAVPGQQFENAECL